MVKFRIKTLCNQYGTTQKDLAERVGLSTTSLSRIITGDQTPSLETLEKIAFALGCEVSELFESTSNNHALTCPKCGAKLKLSVESE